MDDGRRLVAEQARAIRHAGIEREEGIERQRGVGSVALHGQRPMERGIVGITDGPHRGKPIECAVQDDHDEARIAGPG